MPFAEVRKRRLVFDDERRAAVMRFVVGGGMIQEIYYDLMDMMILRWDGARNAR